MSYTLVENLITDSEVERVHANANFGDLSKRDVLSYGVLKCASGYHQGFTSKTICIEHGLIRSDKYELTAKGKQYLYAAWAKENF